MKKFVAYYRVSTVRQGRSGLGLEAQEAVVRGYVGSGEVVGSFTDVESGRRNKRSGLVGALSLVRSSGATLVIAKMDRLARNAAFLMSLLDAKVDFVACDLPGANRLTLVIMAELAQKEAEDISYRTKAALAAKKARGEKMGNAHNFSDAGRMLGGEAMRESSRSNLNNRRASGYASALRSCGLSLSVIASRLNGEGYETARGGKFTSMAVSRVISMYSGVLP